MSEYLHRFFVNMVGLRENNELRIAAMFSAKGYPTQWPMILRRLVNQEPIPLGFLKSKLVDADAYVTGHNTLLLRPVYSPELLFMVTARAGTMRDTKPVTQISVSCQFNDDGKRTMLEMLHCLVESTAQLDGVSINIPISSIAAPRQLNRQLDLLMML